MIFRWYQHLAAELMNTHVLEMADCFEHRLNEKDSDQYRGDLNGKKKKLEFMRYHAE